MGKKQKKEKKVVREKKEMSSKVYEHFFSQKLKNYKSQFSKMKDSEIISKIIKEWQALNGTTKDNLQSIYEEKRMN